jgi:hypothetical protein
MAFRRDIEPVVRAGSVDEERRLTRSGRLATGTVACPRCDAPVGLGAPLSPASFVCCPYCDHGAPLRDFLTLGEPSRPARVAVRVTTPPRVPRPSPARRP